MSESPDTECLRYVVEHRGHKPGCTCTPGLKATERPIPVEAFGQDHWSTFGYLETRVVDHDGVVDRRHMRCDHRRHPQFAHSGGCGSAHPTRLRADVLSIANHDDWDCLDDIEAAGLVENVGTGLHRVYRLTDLGREVAAALRAHKGQGGRWREFVWPRGG